MTLPAMSLAPGRWYPVALHVAWAGILLFWPNQSDITPLSTHRDLIRNDVMLAFVFLLASSLVIAGSIWVPQHPICMAFVILPQQYLVCVTAIGAIHSMWIGEFADGVVRGRPFLVADQLPAVLIAILHTWVVAALFWGLFQARRLEVLGRTVCP